MNPVHFLKYFKGQKQFARLTKKLAAPGEKIHLKGLIGSSKTILAANLSEILQNSMLFLLADREEAAYLYDDLNNLGLGQSVIFFPSSYKRSIQYDQPDQEFIVQRTEALNTIQNSENPYLIITFPEAIVEKVISPENFKKNTLQINAGDKISIRFINEFLFEYGFERVDFVYEPGQFAVRGSIVDIFSYSNEDPYRIDFFGDEVESLRSFNIDTQISKENLKRITVIPDIHTREDEENRISLLEFLPGNTIIFGDSLNSFFYQVNEIHRQTIIARADDENLFNRIVSGETLKNQLKSKTVCDWGIEPGFQPVTVFKFSNAPQPVFNKKFDLLGENLEEYLSRGIKSLFFPIRRNRLSGCRQFFVMLNQR